MNIWSISPLFYELNNKKRYKKLFKLILDIHTMPKVRIKLNSIDINMLNNICDSIREMAKNSGIAISGPIPLPTKKLKVTTRKSPCGNGTATFDRFEMRIHKRLIDLPANEKVLHSIMRMKVPKSVNIKIEMKD
jgi:small subunit ribosomal protein S10